MEADKYQRSWERSAFPTCLANSSKSSVAAEDVATALYHELMDVRRRLDRLESRNADARKTSQT